MGRSGERRVAVPYARIARRMNWVSRSLVARLSVIAPTPVSCPLAILLDWFQKGSRLCPFH